jgi:mannosyltransferase
MDGVPTDRAGPARTMTVGAGTSPERPVPTRRDADADRAPSLAIRAAAGAGQAARIDHEPASLYRAAAILAVLMLATALRVHGLLRQSAWADEITTLLIADPSQSFARFWDLVLADTHPPLYYLLMRCWSAAFGQSDLAARVPSVVFGVLAVGAAAVSFKTYAFRSRMALMLLLAVSPGAIEYAQEARSYSLLLLLSTVITSACFRFIRCRGEENREAIWAIAILTVAGMIAAYTHYFGFLIAAAAGLIAVAAARGHRRRLAGAGIGLVSTIAAFVPWVVYHAHYMSYGVRTSAWIADFPASAAISWFIRLWLGGTPAFIGCMGIAATLLAMPGFRAFARREAACWLGPSLAFIVVAAALVISWHTPVLTSRNLIVLLPALYLAMSSLFDYGAVRWGTPVVAIAAAAQLLLVIQSLPWYYGAATKEQWRESAAFVLAQPGCTEGPIYVYGPTPNYRYLVEKARPRLKLIEIPVEGNTGLSRRPPASDCGVLVWAADLPGSQFDALLSALSVDRSCVRLAVFYWAFVALRDVSGTAKGNGCGFTTGGVSAPSPIVTEGPGGVAPSKTTSTPTLSQRGG